MTRPIRSPRTALTPAQRVVAAKYVRLARYLAGRFAHHSRSHGFDFDELLGVAYEALTHVALQVDRPGRDTKAYFARAITCDLINYLRRERRHNVLLGATEYPVEELTVAGHEAGCILRDAAARALARVPREAREILRLRYLEGLSGVEIARRIGRAPGRVSEIEHKALIELGARPGPR